MHLKVSKNQSKLVKNAIDQWHKNAIIDSNTANRLENSLQVSPFDWSSLAKYSFWVSLLCIFSSLGAIAADKYLLVLLKTIFKAPYSLRCVALSIISICIYRYGYIQKIKNPKNIFSNEAIFFIGIIATAAAIFQLGRFLNLEKEAYVNLLLLSYFAYGIIGYLLNSKLIWIFSLALLGGWMGIETGYYSGRGAYYMSMNYPLRFLMFGIVLIAASCVQGNNQKFKNLQNNTFIMGLLYTFVSLWMLSIFGNHGDIQVWLKARQIELFHWSLLFALASGLAIYAGLKFDNYTTRAFGITFLIINTYTRYFEFFWNATHKAVFFAILAVSFWMLGKKSEKIMNLIDSKNEDSAIPT